MTTMNTTCLSNLGDNGALKLGFAMSSVTVREYKRVKGTPADVADWDAKCAEVASVIEKGDKSAIIAAMQKIQPDAATQAFLKGINEGVAAMQAPIPGWSDATCSMDWKEWACFCNYAAKLNWTADLLSGFSKFGYDCDPAVKSDSAYACAEPPCGSAATKGFFSGWVPWAIGSVAAVGIGTAAVMYYKRRA